MKKKEKVGKNIDRELNKIEDSLMSKKDNFE